MLIPAYIIKKLEDSKISQNREEFNELTISPFIGDNKRTGIKYSDSDRISSDDSNNIFVDFFI